MGVKIPRRSKAAKAREKFRREYGSAERVAFVGALPCCACGRRPTDREPSANHHVWGEGMGRKGPYQAIVPLCDACHLRWHNAGKLSLLQAVGPLRLPGPGYRASYGNVEHRFEQWEDAAAHVELLWSER